MRMVTAHSAIDVRCTVLPEAGGAVLVGAMVAMDQPESAIPAGFGEKMLRQVYEMARECVDRRTGQTLSIRIVGPVNDQRLPDNILARHKAPIAAVERIIAVIAHGEK